MTLTEWVLAYHHFIHVMMFLLPSRHHTTALTHAPVPISHRPRAPRRRQVSGLTTVPEMLMHHPHVHNSHKSAHVSLREGFDNVGRGEQ